MEGSRNTKKDREKENTPKIATGIDDREELQQNASEEEIQTGDYTSVYTFSYDEVDPS